MFLSFAHYCLHILHVCILSNFNGIINFVFAVGFIRAITRVAGYCIPTYTTNKYLMLKAS